jgi:hypothetical protein
MATIDLHQTGATADPGEPDVTLGQLLEFGFEELADAKKHLKLAALSLEDTKNLFRQFQRVAEGGSPSTEAQLADARGELREEYL